MLIDCGSGILEDSTAVALVSFSLGSSGLPDLASVQEPLVDDDVIGSILVDLGFGVELDSTGCGTVAIRSKTIHVPTIV